MELQSLMEFFTLAGGRPGARASRRSAQPVKALRKPVAENIDEREFTRF
jgi:hypothetical protein